MCTIVDDSNELVYHERIVSDDVAEHCITWHQSSIVSLVDATLLVCNLAVFACYFDSHRHAISLWSMLLWYCYVRVVWQRRVLRERVLVFRRFGVQLEAERVDGSMQRRVFVPRHAIRAAVINEGLHWNRAVHYLALMPRSDADDLVLLFDAFEPRLACLLRILHSLRCAEVAQ